MRKRISLCCTHYVYHRDGTLPGQAEKLKDVPSRAAKWPRALTPEDLRDEVENLGVELDDQELITVLRCATHGPR